MRHSLVVRGMSVMTAVVALLSGARTAAAQNSGVVFSGSGGGVVTSVSATLPISDALVRKLIADNLVSDLADADAHNVLLVIDAQDRYVSGKVSKAIVITPDALPGGVTSFVVGDTAGMTGGAVIRIERSGSGTGSGAVVSVTGGSTGDGTSSHGVFGSGYEMSDVAGIGLKRFAPGELATGRVSVSVVKLK